MAAKKKNNKKHLSAGQQIGIGVGLTAAAVGAAGAYFLYGSKNAAQNRKKVKSWMLKAKADVLEQLEAAQKMTKEEYEALIDNVAAGYAKVKDASKVDLNEFKKEMKDHWKKIEEQAKPAKKEAKKTAKKAAKTAKKAAKKAAPKKAAKKTSKKK